jgi:hypothetical protein
MKKIESGGFKSGPEPVLEPKKAIFEYQIGLQANRD